MPVLPSLPLALAVRYRSVTADCQWRLPVPVGRLLLPEPQAASASGPGLHCQWQCSASEKLFRGTGTASASGRFSVPLTVPIGPAGGVTRRAMPVKAAAPGRRRRPRARRRRVGDSDPGESESPAATRRHPSPSHCQCQWQEELEVGSVVDAQNPLLPVHVQQLEARA